MRTGAAAEQARRRRTVAGECSEGAGGKRFLGEKRTFTCSLHETKWQPDRGRRDARIAKFCIASAITARYAGCTPSVRDAVGTVTCPVGKKYDPSPMDGMRETVGPGPCVVKYFTYSV